jgi:hypothetical protein
MGRVLQSMLLNNPVIDIAKHQIKRLKMIKKFL